MIAAVIVYLVILSYLASSNLVSNGADTKLKYQKVSFMYKKEKVIKDATEYFLQSNTTHCQVNTNDPSADNVDDDGNCMVHFSDLTGYIPSGFDFTDNGLNGSFQEPILITDNNTAIRIPATINDRISRNLYIKHYLGKEYGIAPECKNPNNDTNTINENRCLDEYVYHDYPTTLETRAALSN